MRELFSADWYMLRKNGMLFWLGLCIAAIAALCVAAGYMSSRVMEVDLDDGPLMVFPMLIGAAAAILCGGMLDAGFREGTIRNQLTTGHSRGQVFWAAYLAYTAAALLFTGVFVGIIVLVSLTFVMPPQDPGFLIQSLLIGLCTIPAFTALYCTVGVIGGRKGVGMACLIVFAVLLVVSFIIFNVLSEPEMAENYDFGPNGIELVEEVPNPSYVPYPVRSVYEFFNAFLPTGQTLNLMIDSSPVLPVYMLGFTALMLTIGLITMRRRNFQ